MNKCKDCWLRKADPYGKHDQCGYWGFELYQDQRACKQFEERLDFEHMTESKMNAYPLGKPMTSMCFPRDMVSTHDYSNKRHTLRIETVCVNGIWYSGIHYGRHYGSMYGRGNSVSVYDGDFATEREAIDARLKDVLKDETHYQCDEACEFIKGILFEQKQLTLF